MLVLVTVRSCTSSHVCLTAWRGRSVLMSSVGSSGVISLRRAMVRRTLVMRRSMRAWRSTIRRHAVIAHRRSIHARMRVLLMVPSTAAAASTISTTLISIMEIIAHLSLNSLAVRCVSDQRKNRSNDSDKFSTLTWLSVVESCLNDIIGERIA
jgi:hypothetical protein